MKCEFEEIFLGRKSFIQLPIKIFFSPGDIFDFG